MITAQGVGLAAMALAGVTAFVGMTYADYQNDLAADARELARDRHEQQESKCRLACARAGMTLELGPVDSMRICKSDKGLPAVVDLQGKPQPRAVP